MSSIPVNYRCYQCKKSFGCEKTTYKQHMLNNHSSKKQRSIEFPYYCQSCDFGSFSITCYNKHINTKKHKKAIERDQLESLGSSLSS